MTLAWIAASFLIAQPGPPPEPTVGPRSGMLVIDGGALVPEVIREFVRLAGGPESEFVLIPTATERDPVDPDLARERFAEAFGVQHVTVLHTRDRAEADREAFVAPLKTARGVWFGGGRQWRLVDAYLDTRTQRELEAVLARGGVTGGSSAGATIQGSYLVRGAREGNHIMMARGYEAGFGYLRGVAIDQHLLARNRQDDLVAVIEAKRGLLGLGLDEPSAIVVRGDRFQVLGRGVVGIYDGRPHDGRPFYFLAPGEQFDLRSRRRVAGKLELKVEPTPAARGPAAAREVRRRRVPHGPRRFRLGAGPEDLGVGRGRLPGAALGGPPGRRLGGRGLPGRARGRRHPDLLHRRHRLGQAGDRDPR
jgi:cyanophycinase